MKKIVLIIVIVIVLLFLIPIRADILVSGDSSDGVELLQWDFGYDPEEKSYWDYYCIEDEEAIDNIERLLSSCYVHLALPIPGSSASGSITIGYKFKDSVIWIQKNGSVRIEKRGRLCGIYHCYSKDAVEQMFQFYYEADVPIVHEKMYIESADK